MFAELLPRVSRAILTQAVHPRACDPEELARLVQEMQSGVQTEAVPPVARALEAALQWSGPDDVILACGSLFVVAEARTAWRERLPMTDR
jgi:folylpolyglutamate synthase/dihydropteroate synthase